MAYNVKFPFFAALKKRALLSANRNTYHLILDIKGSGITYNPGDSVAIMPENDPELVKKTILYMNGSNEELVDDVRSNTKVTLLEFLSKVANISKVPQALAKNGENFHLWDFLKENKINKSAREICKELFYLRPRLYSIASSYNKDPTELHLIVTLVSYNSSNIERFGTASYFLCKTLKEGNKIPIYVHQTKKFLLPSANTDIIMIGTGSGLAPFIAFLEERLLLKAKGKNWLFFGEQHRETDFYFRSFLTDLEASGFLKLDLAFSRDQPQKIYVQDKLTDNSKEIWNWLNNRSLIYICGNASKMAKDVSSTLLKIVQNEGKMQEPEAISFLQKRLLKEVY